MSLADKKWLTMADVAAVLGITADQARYSFRANRWNTQKKIPGVRVPVWVVHRDEVLAAVNKRGRHATRQP